VDVDGIIHEAIEEAPVDEDFAFTIREVERIIVPGEESIRVGVGGDIDLSEREIFGVLSEDSEARRMAKISVAQRDILRVLDESPGVVSGSMSNDEDVADLWAALALESKVE
jgi:hypothetical protein